jgi:hypothetical protein
MARCLAAIDSAVAGAIAGLRLMRVSTLARAAERFDLTVFTRLDWPFLAACFFDFAFLAFAFFAAAVFVGDRSNVKLNWSLDCLLLFGIPSTPLVELANVYFVDEIEFT